MNVPVIVTDGVTKLPPEANGGIIVGGSNATAYAAYFSAMAALALLFIMTPLFKQTSRSLMTSIVSMRSLQRRAKSM